MPNKKTRLGDEGFSLVELLVSIMILGIVAAPLLHAFITSARTTSKSRAIQNQTLAAQNIAEVFNSYELRDILADIGGSGAGLLSDLSLNADVYTYDGEDDAYTAVDPIASPELIATGEDIYHIGFKNVSISNSTFDAMVNLDATKYPHVNDEPISVYTRMNAVFSQPDDQTQEDGSIILQNPDSIAAAELATQAFFVSGESLDPSYFTHKMLRNIEVNIMKSGSNVTAIALYKYTVNYNYVIPAVYVGGVLVTPAASASATLAYELSPYYFYTGTVDNFTSVHFFYYPNYNTELTSGYDNVTVYNNGGLEFTFFLSKQYNPIYDSDPAQIGAYEGAYAGSLALREPYDPLRIINRTPIASIYTNMNVRLGSTNEFPNGSVLLLYNGFWFNYATSEGKLVEAESLKRLYGITVDLYPAGSNFTGEKLFTFNSSKVE